MTGRILVAESHITISYDLVEDILHVDWTGNQTKESVMDGCERMLQCLRQHQVKKVLNDNTHVTSIWDDASDWVAADWFPRMHRAGCRLFAWVYSPNLYSRLSADKTLSYNIWGVIALSFEDKDTALSWLKVMG